MSLSITTGQAAILAAFDGVLQSAFSGGVQASGPPVMTHVPAYTTLSPDQQEVVKLSFKLAFAALLSELAIKADFSAGLSQTIALAKLTSGGTNGTATFTNGILTGYVAPT